MSYLKCTVCDGGRVKTPMPRCWNCQDKGYVYVPDNNGASLNQDQLWQRFVKRWAPHDRPQAMTIFINDLVELGEKIADDQRTHVVSLYEDNKHTAPTRPATRVWRRLLQRVWGLPKLLQRRPVPTK